MHAPNVSVKTIFIIKLAGVPGAARKEKKIMIIFL